MRFPKLLLRTAYSLPIPRYLVSRLSSSSLPNAKPRVVHIAGNPGSGKSRLLSEICVRCRKTSPTNVELIQSETKRRSCEDDLRVQEEWNSALNHVKQLVRPINDGRPLHSVVVTPNSTTKQRVEKWIEEQLPLTALSNVHVFSLHGWCLQFLNTFLASVQSRGKSFLKKTIEGGIAIPSHWNDQIGYEIFANQFFNRLVAGNTSNLQSPPASSNLRLLRSTSEQVALLMAANIHNGEQKALRSLRAIEDSIRMYGISSDAAMIRQYMSAKAKYNVCDWNDVLRLSAILLETLHRKSFSPSQQNVGRTLDVELLRRSLHTSPSASNSAVDLFAVDDLEVLCGDTYIGGRDTYSGSRDVGDSRQRTHLENSAQVHVLEALTRTVEKWNRSVGYPQPLYVSTGSRSLSLSASHSPATSSSYSFHSLDDTNLLSFGGRIWNKVLGARETRREMVLGMGSDGDMCTLNLSENVRMHSPLRSALKSVHTLPSSRVTNADCVGDVDNSVAELEAKFFSNLSKPPSSSSSSIVHDAEISGSGSRSPISAISLPLRSQSKFVYEDLTSSSTTGSSNENAKEFSSAAVIFEKLEDLEEFDQSFRTEFTTRGMSLSSSPSRSLSLSPPPPTSAEVLESLYWSLQVLIQPHDNLALFALLRSPYLRFRWGDESLRLLRILSAVSVSPSLSLQPSTSLSTPTFRSPVTISSLWSEMQNVYARMYPFSSRGSALLEKYIHEQNISPSFSAPPNLSLSLSAVTSDVASLVGDITYLRTLSLSLSPANLLSMVVEKLFPQLLGKERDGERERGSGGYEEVERWIERLESIHYTLNVHKLPDVLRYIRVLLASISPSSSIPLSFSSSIAPSVPLTPAKRYRMHESGEIYPLYIEENMYGGIDTQSSGSETYSTVSLWTVASFEKALPEVDQLYIANALDSRLPRRVRKRSLPHSPTFSPSPDVWIRREWHRWFSHLLPSTVSQSVTFLCPQTSASKTRVSKAKRPSSSERTATGKRGGGSRAKPSRFVSALAGREGCGMYRYEGGEEEEEAREGVSEMSAGEDRASSANRMDDSSITWILLNHMLSGSDNFHSTDDVRMGSNESIGAGEHGTDARSLKVGVLDPFIREDFAFCPSYFRFVHSEGLDPASTTLTKLHRTHSPSRSDFSSSLHPVGDVVLSAYAITTALAGRDIRNLSDVQTGLQQSMDVLKTMSPSVYPNGVNHYLQHALDFSTRACKGVENSLRDLYGAPIGPVTVFGESVTESNGREETRLMSLHSENGTLDMQRPAVVKETNAATPVYAYAIPTPSMPWMKSFLRARGGKLSASTEMYGIGGGDAPIPVYVLEEADALFLRYPFASHMKYAGGANGAHSSVHIYLALSADSSKVLDAVYVARVDQKSLSLFRAQNTIDIDTSAPPTPSFHRCAACPFQSICSSADRRN